MTRKEKAVLLVDFFYRFNLTTYEKKQCALMCVDEILKVEKGYYGNRETKYWQEVKEEINKL